MIERSDISILLQAILFASIFYALKDQIPPKNSLLKSLAVYRKHFGIFQPKKLEISFICWKIVISLKIR